MAKPNPQGLIERVPKVLIIDDDPVARMILREVLSRIVTVEIVEAVDGVDGLTKAREQRPDLVFLDMNMPVKDGLETLRELREDPELNGFPVIIVSAIVDFEKMRKMMKLGALEYLAKPISYDIKGLGKLVESLGIR